MYNPRRQTYWTSCILCHAHTDKLHDTDITQTHTHINYSSLWQGSNTNHHKQKSKLIRTNIGVPSLRPQKQLGVHVCVCFRSLWQLLATATLRMPLLYSRVCVFVYVLTVVCAYTCNHSLHFGSGLTVGPPSSSFPLTKH